MTDAPELPAGATADPAVAAQSLDQLRADLAQCRQCTLHANATQAVMGRGNSRAALMLVGEQPGNDEDLAGQPFVGPAGRLLQEAMDAAGIDRGQVYLTNAVKHFKWVPQGKRRLHQKPGVREVRACHNWLAAEIRLVRPALVLCLGATAGQAVLGKSFRVGQDRGRRMASPYGPAFATIHPSAILRMPDAASQKAALRAFVFELRSAWDLAREIAPDASVPTPAPRGEAASGGGP